MLNWLAGFVRRWLPAVPAPIVDLVHWAVHALASVVYFVFGNVGKAWDAVWGALGWQLTGMFRFVDAVYQLGRRILKAYFPAVYNFIARVWAELKASLLALYHDALRVIGLVRAELLHLLADLRAWVLRDIWAPLVRTADQLRADLLKWGYTAWWYITHPAALAGILLVPLIAAAEAAIWQIAGPVLTFGTRLVLANIRRVALLAEEVITSVF